MIVGAGTLLNTATVLTGGVVGTVAGHRIPARMRELVVQVLGIFTVAYGVKVAITPSFHEAPHLAIVLIGLLAGTVVGSLLDIDGALLRFGAWTERRLGGGGDAGEPGSGRVARAFVTTSLLYCVGPLTILGSFEDGARGDILLLGIKSTLDGIASLAFAVTLGRGVLLSAGSVLVVQGALTGVAYATRGAVDEFLVTQALGAGGLMLVAIGLGLLEIRRIRVADMLPGLVVAPLVAALSRALGWGLAGRADGGDIANQGRNQRGVTGQGGRQQALPATEVGGRRRIRRRVWARRRTPAHAHPREPGAARRCLSPVVCRAHDAPGCWMKEGKDGFRDYMTPCGRPSLRAETAQPVAAW